MSFEVSRFVYLGRLKLTRLFAWESLCLPKPVWVFNALSKAGINQTTCINCGLAVQRLSITYNSEISIF